LRLKQQKLLLLFIFCNFLIEK
jgi:hypothetical protein